MGLVLCVPVMCDPGESNRRAHVLLSGGGGNRFRKET